MPDKSWTVSLKLPPGVLRNGTQNQAKGRWYDAHLMRFLEGATRPLGGWETLTKDSPAVDITFNAVGVLTLTANILDTETVTIDTKVYTIQDTLTDTDGNVKKGATASDTIDNLIAAITLGAGSGTAYAASTTLHSTVTAVVGPGDTLVASAKLSGLSGVTIVTTETSAGASWGDALLIGSVARAMLAWRNNAANASQLMIGTTSRILHFTQGALVDRTPEDFVAGAVDSTLVVGPYGSGLYGANNFGEGDPAQGTFVEAGVWSLDAFGEIAVGVHTKDGRCLRWDGVTDDLTVMAGAPINCDACVVTAERFFFALGAGGNPRNVQWPSQETLTDWTSTELNTAGDFPLPGAGSIMFGLRGRNETLIFTDQDLFAAQFIGGLLVYAFRQVGSACGAISRHAGAVVNGKVVWMGQKGFFEYDGYVRALDSDVSDHVFSDFNKTQRAKCFVVPMADLGELHFFYPSASSNEPNRHVIYNYKENHWTISSLARTAGVDRGAFDYPYMADLSNIQQHERGSVRAGEAAPFIESGPVDLIGKRIDVSRIIPDESTVVGPGLGNARLFLYTRDWPTAPETKHGPFTLANPTGIRLNTRLVRVRIEEILDGDWRLGDIGLEIAPSSLR